MTDDEKSFRERVEEIRQRREQERAQEEEMSFSERVEEIRQQREQETDVRSFEDAQQVLAMLSNVSAGERTKLSADRVVIETDGELLEFTDQDVFRMDGEGDPTYGITGTPERRPAGSGREDPAGSGHEDPAGDSTGGSSTTRVFSGPESGGSGGGSSSAVGGGGSSPSYCPQCGTDLGSYTSPKFCPDCGHRLSG